jgi:hypothetical protein
VAYVQVRLEAAGAGLGRKPQRMVAAAGNPIVDIGAKMKGSPNAGGLNSQFDRQERRVIKRDCAFFYEPVNLSHFTIPDMSQIKDLRPPETSKLEKIHAACAGRRPDH